jgi:hypothetical protein
MSNICDGCEAIDVAVEPVYLDWVGLTIYLCQDCIDETNKEN